MLRKKVSIKATKLQLETVKSLLEARQDNEPFSIFGQCWLKDGSMDFYYLTDNQTTIVNDALRKANKAP